MYVPPLFENIGHIICPNLHRNSEGGVEVGRNNNTETQLEKCIFGLAVRCLAMALHLLALLT